MDRIFFETHTRDPKTTLPLYVFDSTFLPSPDLINYDQFIPLLVNNLPESPYSLIFLSCGLNKISWIWGIKFLNKFLSNENNLRNLSKIYMVHDSWFIRSITEIMKNYNSTKKLINLMRLLDAFRPGSSTNTHQTASSMKTIIYCSNLSELSQHTDITKLKMSLNVYKFDYLLENSITVPIHIRQVIGQDVIPSNSILFDHFYQLFKILDINGSKIEYLFHNPGNKKNCDILLDCINRNQIIWINDWDLYCIATSFKRILASLPVPLIPIHLIQLPVQDDFSYTLNNLNRILNFHKKGYNSQILLQLFDLLNKMLNNSQTTKHTSTTLSKSLSSSLTHQSVTQDKDNLLIANRFIKNILTNWDRMSATYNGKYPTIEAIIRKEFSSSKTEKYFNSYDLSYNMTVDDTEEEDLEYRIAMDTTNLLHSLSNSNVQDQSTNKKLLAPPKVPPPRKRRFFSDESESSVGSANSNNTTVSDASSISTKDETPPPPPEPETMLKEHKKSLKPAASTPQLRGKKTIDITKHSSMSNLKAHEGSPKKLNFKDGMEKFNNFVETDDNSSKRPVVRGRKVGELTRLYEEKLRGMEFLNQL